MAKTAKEAGSYHLLVKVEKDSVITFGSLGRTKICAGYYIYTGRAKAGLMGRIRRYLGAIKHKRWHIDYLLDRGSVHGIALIYNNFDECGLALKLAEKLAGDRVVKKFGSSDCNCEAHLIKIGSRSGFFSLPWVDEYIKFSRNGMPHSAVKKETLVSIKKIADDNDVSLKTARNAYVKLALKPSKVRNSIEYFSSDAAKKIEKKLSG